MICMRISASGLKIAGARSLMGLRAEAARADPSAGQQSGKAAALRVIRARQGVFGDLRADHRRQNADSGAPLQLRRTPFGASAPLARRRDGDAANDVRVDDVSDHRSSVLRQARTQPVKPLL